MIHCTVYSFQFVNRNHVDTNNMFLFTGKQTDKQLVEEYLNSKYCMSHLYYTTKGKGVRCRVRGEGTTVDCRQPTVLGLIIVSFILYESAPDP